MKPLQNTTEAEFQSLDLDLSDGVSATVQDVYKELNDLKELHQTFIEETQRYLEKFRIRHAEEVKIVRENHSDDIEQIREEHDAEIRSLRSLYDQDIRRYQNTMEGMERAIKAMQRP